MRVTILAAALAVLVSTPLAAKQPTHTSDAALAKAVQLRDAAPVSYTHLDVYKCQGMMCNPALAMPPNSALL